MKSPEVTERFARALASRWQDAEELVELLADLEPLSALTNLERVRRFVVERLYVDARDALDVGPDDGDPTTVLAHLAARQVDRVMLREALSAQFSDAALRRAARESLKRAEQA